MTVLEMDIVTGLIYGNCHFPSPAFPFGFEFCFDLLRVHKIDEADTPDVVGDTVYSPSPEAPWVNIRTIFPMYLPEEFRRRFDEDENELKLSFPEVATLADVSHWTLVDLLWEEKEEELKAAIAVQLNAREYTLIHHYMQGNKFSTKKEQPEA